MTETDDPKVKAHIACKHEQRLKRLSELETNVKDLNNYFESREIKPTTLMGFYNISTDKYVLGTINAAEATLNTDATSAAATTWTVTAGQTWEILGVIGMNSTRNFILTLSIGGTVRFKSASTTSAQTCSLLGNTPQGMPGPITLPAGTAIVLTDAAFQAGDTMSKTIIYRVL